MKLNIGTLFIKLTIYETQHMFIIYETENEYAISKTDYL